VSQSSTGRQVLHCVQDFWALEILGGVRLYSRSSIYPLYMIAMAYQAFHRHANPISYTFWFDHGGSHCNGTLSRNRSHRSGGGAYLRLFPYRYTAAGIHGSIARAAAACVLPIPGSWVQPAAHGEGLISSLRPTQVWKRGSKNEATV